MAKVLSTKLRVGDIDRFTAMAKQQGESKSGLLRRLVLDYLKSYGSGDKEAPCVTLHPDKSSEKGLLPKETNNGNRLPNYQNTPSDTAPCKPLHREGLPSVHYLPPTRLPMPSSAAHSDSLSSASLVDTLSSFRSTARKQPVDYCVSQGRPKALPRSTQGIGWLILLGLIAWGIWSRSANDGKRGSSPSSQSTLVGPSNYADYNEDIATVYRQMGLPYP